jgi:peptidoglycan/LPS O-acetylase OafA/YrhL
MTAASATENQPATSGAEMGRIAALDGLRGLAALVVLVRHAFNALGMPVTRQHELLASPLALVLNAQGAVQLFFVLSGFVLTASLSRNVGGVDLGRFLIRRVLRIQAPYVFALLFAFGASFFYSDFVPGMGLSRWFGHFLGIEVSIPELARYLLFPGTAGGLLDVGWTLQIELLASFLLPFMLMAARRTHWSVLLLFALLLGLDGSLWMFWYLFDFALGMILFLERERIHAFASRLRSPGAWLFSMVALALLSAPMMFSTTAPVLMWRVVPGFQPFDVAIMGLGSAGLIIASTSFAGLSRFLCLAPMAFLGRISFSLYLLHKTLLHLIAPLFVPYDGVIPVVLLYATLIATSLGVATLAYEFIEKPSIRLGRWASQAFAAAVTRRSAD